MGPLSGEEPRWTERLFDRDQPNEEEKSINRLGSHGVGGGSWLAIKTIMCRRVGGISPLTSKSWCWEISGFWLGGKFGPPPRGGFLYNYETNEAKIMAINDTRNYCVHVVQDLCILVATLCNIMNV